MLTYWSFLCTDNTVYYTQGQWINGGNNLGTFSIPSMMLQTKNSNYVYATETTRTLSTKVSEHHTQLFGSIVSVFVLNNHQCKLHIQQQTGSSCIASVCSVSVSLSWFCSLWRGPVPVLVHRNRQLYKTTVELCACVFQLGLVPFTTLSYKSSCVFQLGLIPSLHSAINPVVYFSWDWFPSLHIA